MKIALLTLCSFLIFANTRKDYFDFQYLDNSGNNITIENYSKLPKIIDTTFFKKNFSSLILDEEFTKEDYKFNLRISEVKKVSPKKYDLRIIINPKSEKENIGDILRFTGVVHYEMIIRKVNNDVQIQKITRLYGEV